MKLLLDTHTFLWAIADPTRLSPGAAAALSEETNELVLSTVTLWEIVIKAGLGKLTVPASSEYFEVHMDRVGISRILPISPVHVYALLSLPDAHKDPFDRLLAAQCRVEKLSLVSADRVFAGYPIDVIW